MNENLQEANTNRGAELGELIRKDRVAAGLSQSELARRSGIDKSTIYRLEQGEFSHLTTTPTNIIGSLRALMPSTRNGYSASPRLWALK